MTRDEVMAIIRGSLAIECKVKGNECGEECILVSLVLDGDEISWAYIDMPKND